jgi:hypothetical protein
MSMRQPSEAIFASRPEHSTPVPRQKDGSVGIFVTVTFDGTTTDQEASVIAAAAAEFGAIRPA